MDASEGDAETDGEPACPFCGSPDHYELKGYKRVKRAAKGCREVFSVTVGTPFANHKLPFRRMLVAARQFAIGAKGLSAISLSKDLKCDYKAALALQHKRREAIELTMRDVRLTGVVEVDGKWAGGCINPENVTINCIERRTHAPGSWNAAGARRSPWRTEEPAGRRSAPESICGRPEQCKR